MTYFMCFIKTSYDVPFMRYNLLKVLGPLFDL